MTVVGAGLKSWFWNFELKYLFWIRDCGYRLKRLLIGKLWVQIPLRMLFWNISAAYIILQISVQQNVSKWKKHRLTNKWKNCKSGSGCASVCRAVDSDTRLVRSLQFESSHRQTLYYPTVLKRKMVNKCKNLTFVANIPISERLSCNIQNVVKIRNFFVYFWSFPSQLNYKLKKAKLLCLGFGLSYGGHLF